MGRWSKLAKKLTKVRPKTVLGFLESFVDRMIKTEVPPDINYPNRSITIEAGTQGLIIQLAKHRAILDIDKMLSVPSLTQLQWWIHSQLVVDDVTLSQEDAATISALMVQKLQEREYIKDVTPPV